MVLYEHVVKLVSIPEDIEYKITSSYEKTDLILNKQNWKREVPSSVRERYLREIDELERKLGYIGVGRENLIRAVNGIDIDIDMVRDFQYASYVPHAMLYVGVEAIRVNSTSKIVIR